MYDRVIVARTHARTHTRMHVRAHQQTKNDWKILKIIHWSKVKSSSWMFWIVFYPL